MAGPGPCRHGRGAAEPGKGVLVPEPVTPAVLPTIRAADSTPQPGMGEQCRATELDALLIELSKLVSESTPAAFGC